MPLSYQDQEHLRLLSIFHYVEAVFVALISCIPLLYFFGIFALIFASDKNAAPIAAPIGLFFMVLGGFVTLFGWVLACLLFLAGKFLAERKNYIYCMVVAGLNCMHAPLGTILGVLTFVVLLRPEVKAAFEGQAPLPQYAAPMPPAQQPQPPQPPA